MTIKKLLRTNRVSHYKTAPFTRLIGALLIGLSLSGCSGSSHTSSTSSVPNPSIEGPIAGNPFVSATSFALADVGYE